MKKFIFAIMLGLTVVGTSVALTPATAYADKSDEFELTVGIKNPLGDKTEIKDIVAAILKTIVEIAIPIVIVMVIYSGFLYVMAQGKPEAIEKAHKTLTYTLLGAAILLGAQLIATVLIDTISNIAKDANVSTTATSGGTGSTTSSSKTTTTTGGTTSGGTSTGGSTTAGGTTSSTTVPSFIKDLKFNLISETSTTAKGTFDFYVTNNFTPKAGTIKIYCIDDNNQYTLSQTDPAPGVSDFKVGTYTTSALTLNGSGLSDCHIGYDFGNSQKLSNVVTIKVPSKTVTTPFVLTDPIFPLSKLDNLQVRAEIKAFGPTSISYDLDIVPGLKAAGITCMENNPSRTTVPGNWEDDITIPGFKMGFIGKSITSPMNFLPGMNYVCVIEYDDPKNPGFWMVTKNFPLQIGAKNR